MESQPQTPEFRNNAVNFHPCLSLYGHLVYVDSFCFLKILLCCLCLGLVIV